MRRESSENDFPTQELQQIPLKERIKITDASQCKYIIHVEYGSQVATGPTQPHQKGLFDMGSVIKNILTVLFQ